MSICVVRAIRRARVSLEALLWTAMPRMQALGVGGFPCRSCILIQCFNLHVTRCHKKDRFGMPDIHLA